VPGRNWNKPSRVCDGCFEDLDKFEEVDFGGGGAELAEGEATGEEEAAAEEPAPTLKGAGKRLLQRIVSNGYVQLVMWSFLEIESVRRPKLLRRPRSGLLAPSRHGLSPTIGKLWRRGPNAPCARGG
jgi:hypothetical protein